MRNLICLSILSIFLYGCASNAQKNVGVTSVVKNVINSMIIANTAVTKFNADVDKYNQLNPDNQKNKFPDLTMATITLITTSEKNDDNKLSVLVVFNKSENLKSANIITTSLMNSEELKKKSLPKNLDMTAYNNVENAFKLEIDNKKIFDTAPVSMEALCNGIMNELTYVSDRKDILKEGAISLRFKITHDNSVTDGIAYTFSDWFLSKNDTHFSEQNYINTVTFKFGKDK